MTDGGFRFHVGTPLPDLRHIASWMITRAPRQRTLHATIPALEATRKEDVSVAGLLLANLDRLNWDKTRGWRSSTCYNERNRFWSYWRLLKSLFEEASVPDDAWLRAASGQSPHWHQYCVLFLSLRRTEGDGDLVEQAPQGGEMFERIEVAFFNRRVDGCPSPVDWHGRTPFAR